MLFRPRRGQYFHDVPGNAVLVKNDLIRPVHSHDNVSPTEFRYLYLAHRDAHTPQGWQDRIRHFLHPQEPNPWEYGAELLEWGLHQPWADSIHLQRIAHNCHMFHPERMIALPWLTLPQRLPEPYAHQWAEALLGSHYDIHVHRDIELQTLMAWAVCFILLYPHCMPLPASAQWKKICDFALQYRTIEGDHFDERLHHQRTVLRNIPTAHFHTSPHEVWTTLLHRIYPSVWIQEAEYLKYQLAFHESDLLEHLPFSPADSEDPRSGYWNEQLMRVFCPTIYPVLAAVITPKEWYDREVVLRIGKTYILAQDSSSTSPIPMYNTPYEP